MPMGILVAPRRRAKARPRAPPRAESQAVPNLKHVAVARQARAQGPKAAPPKRAGRRAAGRPGGAATTGSLAAPLRMSRSLGNWVSYGDCRKIPALSARI